MAWSMLCWLLALLTLSVLPRLLQADKSECPVNPLPPSRHLVCYTHVEYSHPDVCSCSLLVHLEVATLQVTRQNPPTIRKLREWTSQKVKGRRNVVRVTATKGLSTATDDEFAAAIAKFVREEGLDGVEMAVEASTKHALLTLLKKIRSALPSSAILLVAVPGTPAIIAKHLPLKELSQIVDLFSLETHYLPSPDSLHQHPARLVAPVGDADPYTADAVVDFVLSQGAPADRLILGVPSWVWRYNNSPQPKKIPRSEWCREISSGKYKIERDDDMTSPRAINGHEILAYDDLDSISIKTKYALTRELAGLSVHTLEADESCDNGTSLIHHILSTMTDLVRRPRGAALAAIEAQLPREEEQLPCSRQGYFAHPKSCNRFYRCVKFNQYKEEWTIFHHDCPAGLAFDERWEVCVWPGSLPHGAPCSGSSEIAPVPRQRFECPSVEGYYADPENCRWFFACLDHARDGHSPLTAYEFRCPFGLVFDPEHLSCEWPWKVAGCGAGGVRLLFAGAAYTGEGRYLAAYGGYPDTLISGGRSQGAEGVILEQNVLHGLNYGQHHTQTLFQPSSHIVGSGLGIGVGTINGLTVDENASNVVLQKPLINDNKLSVSVQNQNFLSSSASQGSSGIVLGKSQGLNYYQSLEAQKSALSQSGIAKAHQQQPGISSVAYGTHHQNQNILSSVASQTSSSPGISLGQSQGVNYYQSVEGQRSTLSQPGITTIQQQPQPEISSVIYATQQQNQNILSTLASQTSSSSGINRGQSQGLNYYQNLEAQKSTLSGIATVHQQQPEISSVVYGTQQANIIKQPIIAQTPVVPVQPVVSVQKSILHNVAKSSIVQEPAPVVESIGINEEALLKQAQIIQQQPINKVYIATPTAQRFIQQPAVSAQKAFIETVTARPVIQQTFIQPVVKKPTINSVAIQSSITPFTYQQTVLQEPRVNILVKQPQINVVSHSGLQTLKEQQNTIQGHVVQPVIYQSQIELESGNEAYSKTKIEQNKQKIVVQPQSQSIIVGQEATIKAQPFAYQQTLIEQPKTQSIVVQQSGIKVQPVFSRIPAQPVIYQKTIIEQPKIQPLIVEQPRIKVQHVAYQQAVIEQPQIQPILLEKPRIQIQTVTPKIQKQQIAYQQTVIEQPNLQSVLVEEPKLKIQTVTPRIQVQPIIYQEQPKLQPVIVEQPRIKIQKESSRVQTQPVAYQQINYEQPKIQQVFVEQPRFEVQSVTPRLQVQPVTYQQTIIEQPKLQQIVAKEPKVNIQTVNPRIQVQPVIYQQPKVQSVVIEQPKIQVSPRVQLQPVNYQQTIIEQPKIQQQNIKFQPVTPRVLVEPITYQQTFIDQPKIQPLVVEQPRIKIQSVTPRVQVQPVAYQQTVYEQPKIQQVVVEQPRLKIHSVTPSVQVQPVAYQQTVYEQPRIKIQSVTPRVQVQPVAYQQTVYEQPKIQQVVVEQPRLKIQPVSPKVQVQPVTYQQTVYEQPKIQQVVVEQPRIKIQSVTPRVQVQPIAYQQTVYEQPKIQQVVVEQPRIKIQPVTPKVQVQPVAYQQTVYEQPKIQQVVVEQPRIKIQSVTPRVQVQPIAYQQTVYEQPKIQQVIVEQPRLKVQPVTPRVQVQPVTYQQTVYEQPKIQQVVVEQPRIKVQSVTPRVQVQPVGYQQTVYEQPILQQVAIKQPRIKIQTVTPRIQIQPVTYQQTVFGQPKVVLNQQIKVQQQVPVTYKQNSLVAKLPITPVVKSNPVIIGSNRISQQPKSLVVDEPIQDVRIQTLKEQTPLVQFHTQTLFQPTVKFQPTAVPLIEKSPAVSIVRQRPLIVQSTPAPSLIAFEKQPIISVQEPLEQFHRQTFFEAAKIKQTPVTPLFLETSKTRVLNPPLISQTLYQPAVKVQSTAVPLVEKSPVVNIIRQRPRPAFVIQTTPAPALSTIAFEKQPIISVQQPLDQFHKQTFFESVKIKQTPVTVAPVLLKTSKTRVLNYPAIISPTLYQPAVKIQSTAIPLVEKHPVVNIVKQRTRPAFVIQTTRAPAPSTIFFEEQPIISVQEPLEQFHRQTLFESAKIKQTPVTVAPVLLETSKTKVLDSPVIITTSAPIVQVKRKRVRVRPLETSTPCPNTQEADQFHKLTLFEPVNRVVSTSSTSTARPPTSTIAVDDNDVKIILNQYASDLGRLGDKEAFISDVIAGHNEKILSTTPRAKSAAKKVVLVSNLADRHPLLVSKLGAQCTCEPEVKLRVRGRGKGRNRGTTTTTTTEAYEDESDEGEDSGEGDVVEIASPRELKKQPIGVVYASTTETLPRISTSAPRISTKSSRISSSAPRSFTSAPSIAILAPRISTLAPRISLNDPFLIRVSDDQSPAIIKSSRRQPESSGRSSGKDAGEIPIERYGPGGRRGFKETLQGSIDCQRPGLFRHPKHCDKFYACHWDESKGRYTLHVFNCPVHLAYDENIGACNWPSAGPGCAQDNLLV